MANSLATAAVDFCWISTPLRITEPCCGLSSRAKDLSKVLLPQPLLPISTEILPWGSCMSSASIITWR
ncbi:hypothetical protein D3C85_1069890 [compost metagenome]